MPTHPASSSVDSSFDDFGLVRRCQRRVLTFPKNGCSYSFNSFDSSFSSIGTSSSSLVGGTSEDRSGDSFLSSSLTLTESYDSTAVGNISLNRNPYQDCRRWAGQGGLSCPTLSKSQESVTEDVVCNNLKNSCSKKWQVSNQQKHHCCKGGSAAKCYFISNRRRTHEQKESSNSTSLESAPIIDNLILEPGDCFHNAADLKDKQHTHATESVLNEHQRSKGDALQSNPDHRKHRQSHKSSLRQASCAKSPQLGHDFLDPNSELYLQKLDNVLEKMSAKNEKQSSKLPEKPTKNVNRKEALLTTLTKSRTTMPGKRSCECLRRSVTSNRLIVGVRRAGQIRNRAGVKLEAVKLKNIITAPKSMPKPRCQHRGEKKKLDTVTASKEQGRKNVISTNTDEKLHSTSGSKKRSKPAHAPSKHHSNNRTPFNYIPYNLATGNDKKDEATVNDHDFPSRKLSAGLSKQQLEILKHIPEDITPQEIDCLFKTVLSIAERWHGGKTSLNEKSARERLTCDKESSKSLKPSIRQQADSCATSSTLSPKPSIHYSSKISDPINSTTVLETKSSPKPSSGFKHESKQNGTARKDFTQESTNYSTNYEITSNQYPKNCPELAPAVVILDDVAKKKPATVTLLESHQVNDCVADLSDSSSRTYTLSDTSSTNDHSRKKSKKSAVVLPYEGNFSQQNRSTTQNEESELLSRYTVDEMRIELPVDKQRSTRKSLNEEENIPSVEAGSSRHMEWRPPLHDQTPITDTYQPEMLSPRIFPAKMRKSSSVSSDGLLNHKSNNDSQISSSRELPRRNCMSSAVLPAENIGITADTGSLFERRGETEFMVERHNDIQQSRTIARPRCSFLLPCPHENIHRSKISTDQDSSFLNPKMSDLSNLDIDRKIIQLRAELRNTYRVPVDVVPDSGKLLSRKSYDVIPETVKMANRISYDEIPRTIKEKSPRPYDVMLGTVKETSRAVDNVHPGMVREEARNSCEAISGTVKKASRVTCDVIARTMKEVSSVSYDAIPGTMKETSTMSYDVMPGTVKEASRVNYDVLAGTITERSHGSYSALAGTVKEVPQRYEGKLWNSKIALPNFSVSRDQKIQFGISSPVKGQRPRLGSDLDALSCSADTLPTNTSVSNRLHELDDDILHCSPSSDWRYPSLNLPAINDQTQPNAMSSDALTNRSSSCHSYTSQPLASNDQFLGQGATKQFWPQPIICTPLESLYTNEPQRTNRESLPEAADPLMGSTSAHLSNVISSKKISHTFCVRAKGVTKDFVNNFVKKPLNGSRSVSNNRNNIRNNSKSHVLREKESHFNLSRLNKQTPRKPETPGNKKPNNNAQKPTTVKPLNRAGFMAPAQINTDTKTKTISSIKQIIEPVKQAVRITNLNQLKENTEALLGEVYKKYYSDFMSPGLTTINTPELANALEMLKNFSPISQVDVNTRYPVSLGTTEKEFNHQSKKNFNDNSQKEVPPGATDSAHSAEVPRKINKIKPIIVNRTKERTTLSSSSAESVPVAIRKKCTNFSNRRKGKGDTGKHLESPTNSQTEPESSPRPPRAVKTLVKDTLIIDVSSPTTCNDMTPSENESVKKDEKAIIVKTYSSKSAMPENLKVISSEKSDSSASHSEAKKISCSLKTSPKSRKKSTTPVVVHNLKKQKSSNGYFADSSNDSQSCIVTHMNSDSCSAASAARERLAHPFKNGRITAIRNSGWTSESDGDETTEESCATLNRQQDPDTTRWDDTENINNNCRTPQERCRTDIVARESCCTSRGTKESCCTSKTRESCCMSNENQSAAIRRPSTKILGELAFQLERRMLDYVFGLEGSRKRRFYGYTVNNICDMMNKESKTAQGKDDTIRKTELAFRLKSLLVGLRKCNYDIEEHAEFAQEIVNKYGLLACPLDSGTIEEFGLQNANKISALINQLAKDDAEANNLQILLLSLKHLSKCDGRPLFVW